MIFFVLPCGFKRRVEYITAGLARDQCALGDVTILLKILTCRIFLNELDYATPCHYFLHNSSI